MSDEPNKKDSLQKRTFMQKCITLRDLCQHNELDEDVVTAMIAASHISFGTNADTLMTCFTLEQVLGRDLNWGDLDNSVLISLGC
jgi:hypothetical protein